MLVVSLVAYAQRKCMVVKNSCCINVLLKSVQLANQSQFKTDTKIPKHVQVYILTSMTYNYKNQNGSHGVQIRTIINEAQQK